MKNAFGKLIVLALLIVSNKSSATWSITIVDPVTKEIGVAAASCTFSVYGIAGIVPGKGAVVAQAMSNMKAKAKALDMLRAGYSPDSIVYTIIDPRFDPNYSQQQYGIVSTSYPTQPVTFTGGGTHMASGSVTADGISIQGNTLANDQVLKAVFDTVMNARSKGLSIRETLMKALQAGSQAGGDKRCGKQTASSAFITVMKANDDPKKPYLNLFVSGISRGGRNAVEVLKGMYQKWAVKNK